MTTTHITFGTYGADLVSDVRPAGHPYTQGVLLVQLDRHLAGGDWHKLNAAGIWSKPVGRTTQGDAVYELTGEQLAEIEAITAPEPDQPLTVATSKIIGSRVFPGLRGYEEGEEASLTGSERTRRLIDRH